MVAVALDFAAALSTVAISGAGLSASSSPQTTTGATPMHTDCLIHGEDDGDPGRSPLLCTVGHPAMIRTCSASSPLFTRAQALPHERLDLPARGPSVEQLWGGTASIDVHELSGRAALLWIEDAGTGDLRGDLLGGTESSPTSRRRPRRSTGRAAGLGFAASDRHLVQELGIDGGAGEADDVDRTPRAEFGSSGWWLDRRCSCRPSHYGDA